MSSGAGLRRQDCSLTSLHEASHCIVGRFFGLPIASVTIIPTEFFFGQCRGPQSNPNDGPEALLAAAKAVCEKALAAMPRAGEDGLEFAAPWISHVASRVTELLAGFAGERLANYAADGETGSSDLSIAEVYAATIAAPSAIGTYLDFCRRSAEGSLRNTGLPSWPWLLCSMPKERSPARKSTRP